MYPRFIEVHNIDDESPMSVNVENITNVHVSDDAETVIEMSSREFYLVKESYDELKTMIKDCGCLINLFADSKRTTCHDNHDDGFAGSHECVHHLYLGTRQIEVRAATRFARKDGFFAAEKENDVRFLSRRNGFGYTDRVLITAVCEPRLVDAPERFMTVLEGIYRS